MSGCDRGVNGTFDRPRTQTPASAQRSARRLPVAPLVQEPVQPGDRRGRHRAHQVVLVPLLVRGLGRRTSGRVEALLVADDPLRPFGRPLVLLEVPALLRAHRAREVVVHLHADPFIHVPRDGHRGSGRLFGDVSQRLGVMTAPVPQQVGDVPSVHPCVREQHARAQHPAPAPAVPPRSERATQQNQQERRHNHEMPGVDEIRAANDDQQDGKRNDRAREEHPCVRLLAPQPAQPRIDGEHRDDAGDELERGGLRRAECPCECDAIRIDERLGGRATAIDDEAQVDQVQRGVEDEGRRLQQQEGNGGILRRSPRSKEPVCRPGAASSDHTGEDRLRERAEYDRDSIQRRRTPVRPGQVRVEDVVREQRTKHEHRVAACLRREQHQFVRETHEQHRDHAGGITPPSAR